MKLQFIIFRLLIICIGLSSLIAGCDANNEKFENEFLSPPGKYKPMPFWHINGELTTEGIKTQMKDAKELAGFSGISVLPLAPKKNGRPGTTPKFLTEDYLHRFQDVLNTAEDLDMEVILYDDNDFPSGMAGGKLGELFPQHTMKRLDKIEKEVVGPAIFNDQVPEGEILSIVAMNNETFERKELSELVKDGILHWTVPRGEWKIMYFTMVKDSHHKAFPVVDYLDTTAVREMIKLTYEVYKEHFGSYFGNTIKMSFFDDVGFWKHPRTWTGGFNKKFKELNGFDPKPWYPALWYNIGPETEAVRNAFFVTRAELLAEGFPKLVGDWAKKNGLKDTGHPPGNYDPTPIDMNGDIFKFFRHTAIPLTDAIIKYQFGQNGHKLISSAADYYDRSVVSTEIYGAYKENSFDSLMLYRSMMDMFVRGVNFVVPHGLWYNPDQVYISPLVSPYSQKLAPALLDYSEFVGRSCMLLQGGRRVADIGVFYPFEELAGWYRFEDPDNPRQGFFVSPETDYQEVSGMLTNEIRQDFTFIHPEFFLDEKYEVEQGIVTLKNLENRQEYKALIITGCNVISYKTLKKIKAFYDNGGIVISTTQLPFKSSEMGQDEMVIDLVNEIFGMDPLSTMGDDTQQKKNENGGHAFFIPNPTPQEISNVIQGLVIPDVQFSPVPKLSTDLGKFSYIHKVKDGKDIFYFSNSSDEAIETEVILKGKLELRKANPHNGKISEINGVTYFSIDDQVYTKSKIRLLPVTATFWISD
ncbi:MAG: hypothetical protein HKN68_00815 [Saprospiraceae bacterium]|nr:hypothetical protein [Saprospiraceae bacterium]